MPALTRSTARSTAKFQAQLRRAPIALFQQVRSTRFGKNAYGSGPSAVHRSSPRGLSAGTSNSNCTGSKGDISNRNSIDGRSRWLPNQPTFVCPPSMAQGPPSPSDQAWAERGIFLSYSKAHLSYREVATLLQLPNLDITAADFRFATVVVWAYRTCTQTDGNATDATPAPKGAVSPAPFPNPSGKAGCSGMGIELVGFASADVAAPAPTPAQPQVRTAAGAAGSGGGGAAHVAALRLCSGGSDIRSGGSQGAGTEGPAAAGGEWVRCGRPRAQTFPRQQGRWTHKERPRSRRSRDGVPLSARDNHLGRADSSSTTVAVAAEDGACRDGGQGRAGYVATVRYLAVHPGLRRQGLGRTLLERLVSELHAGPTGGGNEACATVLVTLRATSWSAGFYDRLGLLRCPAAPLVKA